MFKHRSKDQGPSMASSNERASCYFSASLGALDLAIVERLKRWAGESCVEHVLHHNEGASVTLYAVRNTAKTARQYQSLLRTLTSNWKMSFGKLERGWLALLSEEEYRGAVQTSPVCAQTELNDNQQAGVPSWVCANGGVAPTQAVSGDSAHRTQQRAPDGCVALLSLGEGFDERAKALCDKLIGAH